MDNGYIYLGGMIYAFFSQKEKKGFNIGTVGRDTIIGQALLGDEIPMELLTQSMKMVWQGRIGSLVCQSSGVAFELAMFRLIFLSIARWIRKLS